MYELTIGYNKYGILFEVIKECVNGRMMEWFFLVFNFGIFYGVVGNYSFKFCLFFWCVL